MVAPLTVSLASTPDPAATESGVLITPLYASATAVGAAKTVKVTVAVELPAKFDRTYLKVSAPVKAAAGV